MNNGSMLAYFLPERQHDLSPILVMGLDHNGVRRFHNGKEVARPERFELPTPRFEAWCSVQLSYGRNVIMKQEAREAWTRMVHGSVA